MITFLTAAATGRIDCARTCGTLTQKPADRVYGVTMAQCVFAFNFTWLEAVEVSLCSLPALFIAPGRCVRRTVLLVNFTAI